jgi:hypothetical protein
VCLESVSSLSHAASRPEHMRTGDDDGAGWITLEVARWLGWLLLDPPCRSPVSPILFAHVDGVR